MSGSRDSDDPRPAAKPLQTGSGGGSAKGPPECQIVERATINSPDKTVVVTVRVGDQLTISYVPGPPKQLLASTMSGAVLGSLTPPSMAQLILCIQSGVHYKATVLAISGGRVDVQIEPL